MDIKYFYIDDEKNQTVQSYIDAVTRHSDNLSIEHIKPKPFSEQITFLRKADYDGLILDLRLDQVAQKSGRINFRASTLAQEIRTRATEKNFDEFPIALWSTDSKISRSYLNDDTSHDLFDLIELKDNITDPEEAKRIASELHDLGVGYKDIAKIRKNKGPGIQFHKFLGLEDEPDFFDPRIESFFKRRNGKGSIPVHEYSRFIIRDFLDKPSLLVNESILLSRLGIDIGKSPGWNSIKDNLDSCKYKGPFNKCWPRWWWPKVEKWWDDYSRSPKPLIQTTAKERVEFLKSNFNLDNIEPAEPIEKSYKSNFWTICKIENKPLSTNDGFILDGQDQKPWQDKQYVSKIAAINKIHKYSHYNIHPLEKERFERLKKSSN